VPPIFHLIDRQEGFKLTSDFTSAYYRRVGAQKKGMFEPFFVAAFPTLLLVVLAEGLAATCDWPERQNGRKPVFQYQHGSSHGA
jgi:hypothetical protein